MARRPITFAQLLDVVEVMEQGMLEVSLLARVPRRAKDAIHRLRHEVAIPALVRAGRRQEPMGGEDDD